MTTVKQTHNAHQTGDVMLARPGQCMKIRYQINTRPMIMGMKFDELSVSFEENSNIPQEHRPLSACLFSGIRNHMDFEIFGVCSWCLLEFS